MVLDSSHVRYEAVWSTLTLLQQGCHPNNLQLYRILFVLVEIRDFYWTKNKVKGKKNSGLFFALFFCLDIYLSVQSSYHVFYTHTTYGSHDTHATHNTHNVRNVLRTPQSQLCH